MDSQEQLYNNLLKLTKENEAFYFVDYGPYRVFNYRLASYTDFLAEDALEARGIMFYMAGDYRDIPQLVCRPFKKFFNKDENPFTMNLDWSPENVEKVAVKEDGSIISSYIDVPTGELRLKSKQSLYSEQTQMANQLLRHPDYEDLRYAVDVATRRGNTVIFELVSPTNRIVLEYQSTELRVLGVRNNVSGNILPKVSFLNYVLWEDPGRILVKHWVKEYTGLAAAHLPPEDVAQMEGIEGFVYTLRDGTMVKVKTDWYKNLHHLKDSINATRHLFEAVIEERIDDVKALFATDQFTMDRIKAMEDLVIPKYNHMVKTVEDFYDRNKELSFKDFAILGQKELGAFFHLAMAKKRGAEVDYKTFSKKHAEEHFGVSFKNEEYAE